MITFQAWVSLNFTIIFSRLLFNDRSTVLDYCWKTTLNCCRGIRKPLVLFYLHFFHPPTAFLKIDFNQEKLLPIWIFLSSFLYSTYKTSVSPFLYTLNNKKKSHKVSNKRHLTVLKRYPDIFFRDTIFFVIFRFFQQHFPFIFLFFFFVFFFFLSGNGKW